jgi:hypothetical protein
MAVERIITSAGHPTFTLTKLMRATAEDRLALQTVVEVEGVELTINELAYMLREARNFDSEWRGQSGIGIDGLQRLGSI